MGSIWCNARWIALELPTDDSALYVLLSEHVPPISHLQSNFNPHVRPDTAKF